MRTHITVLIIDDDPEICSLFEVVFSTYNATTISAKTLGEAQKMLDKFIPSCIVLDNSLPDGKGLDFMNYLLRTFPCTKVIFCSGDDFETEIKRRGLNVHAVLKKPFMINDLHALIKDIA